MNEALKTATSPINDTDATVLQRRAANPQNSSWVGASAGSGKTKVLTDRILRLLLPQPDGRPGTKPHKILALTFTKAAASEMSARVRKQLSAWAITSPEKLEKDLADLLGRAATADERQAARRLFAEVVDAPGGLPIMTIHAFCQSVLGRFPLEAAIAPDFTLIEDAAQATLLAQAKNVVLTRISQTPGSPESEAFYRLAPLLDEDGLDTMIRAVRSEERQLKALKSKGFSLYDRLCTSMGVQPGNTPENLIEAFCATCPDENLRQAARRMIKDGGSTNTKRGQPMADWLAADLANRIQSYDTYAAAFIGKSTGEPYKNIATAALEKASPGIETILQEEARRILSLKTDLGALACATATTDLFTFTEAVLDEYHRMKAGRGVLDFDDLIIRTLDLLEGRAGIKGAPQAAAWVMYKLDQGIDHILVDEAQDTNPEQWDVIKALAEDFFAGENAHTDNRTLFVVGDEKQSIFSFQRAAPDKFRAMEAFFAKKIRAAEQAFESVPITISFRSARAVLEAVDATFAAPELQQSLGGRVLPHSTYRSGQPGLVELWPLFETEKDDLPSPLSLPIHIRDTRSGAAKLAGEIAAIIQSWIGREILPSHDRPVEAGDIMVLVRTRGAFVGQLVRALKQAGVPVSGVDRMVLAEQIAVQDLCAAMQVALLPEDDLSLAELLKSPLIDWSDDDLIEVAAGRGKGETLWQALKSRRPKDRVISWLSALIRTAGQVEAYEFCAGLLSRPCPADDRSGLQAMKKRLGTEALDPLDELLSLALAYDQQDGRGLQIFLQQFSETSGEIKRQMDESGGAVRIMTVHASKGLQAPIVILPDTTRAAAGRKGDTLYWPERSNLDLPYFVPDKTMAVRRAADAKARYEQLAEEEYARLLYVAMTRAEDRLYVCGYKGTQNILPASWHNYVSTAFTNLDGVEALDDGRLRYSNPASAKPDRVRQTGIVQEQTAPLPDWLTRRAPEEPDPPRPLIPSRPSESDSDIPALSPLKAPDQSRFKRGNITHKLLQILPGLDPASRGEAMSHYLAQPAHSLPPDIQAGIASEVEAILAHPDFAPLFGAGSQAEVTVTGLLDDKTIISGQIDRLLITDEEILIIDYKTNRPPPERRDDVPAVYIKQMDAYRRALALIYPDRPIRTALLWTMGARLMEIE